LKLKKRKNVSESLMISACLVGTGDLLLILLLFFVAPGKKFFKQSEKVVVENWIR
jgi:hypothetical protein